MQELLAAIARQDDEEAERLAQLLAPADEPTLLELLESKDEDERWWAVRGLARSASLELGPRGIRVNVVDPGFIDTDMTRSAPEAFREASVGDTALGRAGQPREVATVVAFLLGDDASYVTGAEIAVDGGSSGHAGAKTVSDALRPTYRNPSLPQHDPVGQE